MAQVYYLDTVKIQVERCGKLCDNLVVTQQDRVAYTLGLGLYGSLKHCWVYGLCKYHALWVGGCGSIELLCQLGLLSQQYRQRALVLVPVLNLLTSHATLDGSLGYSR